MTMKNRSLHRLIRPMMQDQFHGSLMQRYHTYNPNGELTPLNIVEPSRIIKPAPEKIPLVPSTSKLSGYDIVGPGMILLRRYVSIKDEADIWKTCRKWAMGPSGLNTSTKDFGRYMMCLGRNWDPVTGYENHCKSDDSEPPPPLSHELISLAQAAVRDAQIHLNELPSMLPNICEVNFYPKNGRLDLHQDRGESFNSLKRGLPVVFFSFGEVGVFEFGRTKGRLKTVLLGSGDVLIFGGKSRHIYYKVLGISEFLYFRPFINESERIIIRLSLTFRQI